MDIVIRLDSIQKFRPGSRAEYRYVNRASFGDLEIVGDGYLLTRILQEISEVSPERMDDQVMVYRGETLCFEPASLRRWVAKREQPEQLRKK